MKYELGMYDACADAHGKGVIEEMREAVGHAPNPHSVVVCVYADGFLQFAGGDACCSSAPIELQRKTVKSRAGMILSRFNPDGVIFKKGGDK